MSYTLIAQEDILMRNATAAGSSETRTFKILEQFAETPDTVTEIGIKGDPMLIMGSRGNDMFFPFWPVQIQFTIKDLHGLLARFDGRSKKDFKLQIYNDATLEWELFLYLPSSNKEYYERYPEIGLVATNALGLLKEEYFNPADVYIELDQFLIDCFDRLGLPGSIEFYSLWASSDNASTFPVGYRVKQSYMAKFSDNDRLSYWDLLVNFCEQFNLQLYQIEQRWVFIERKMRLNAPATLNGVVFSSGVAASACSRDFRQVITSDLVELKPKADFKPGIREIKSVVKIADTFLTNADLTQSKPLQNIIPAWDKEESTGSVIVTGDVDGQYVQLHRSPDNSITEGWLKQRSQTVIANNSDQLDTVKISFTLDLDVDTDVSEVGDVYSINYFRGLFYSLDGLVYILNNDSTWDEYTTDDARFARIIPEGSLVTITNSLNVQAPYGKVGYIQVEYRLHDTGLGDELVNSCSLSIKSSSIELLNDTARSSKFYIHSRGLLNPSALQQSFCPGDVDDYGALFVFEYFDTNDDWVPADYISNNAIEGSVFTRAPYDRISQANKDSIVYTTAISRKFIFPDFLKTIVLQETGNADVLSIPVEYKWNMVTGEVEVYSVESVFDTTGITNLKFYSESEYQAIDPETVITDQGDVLYGFTKGTVSEDGRGFDLVFDDAVNSAADSSAFVEIEGIVFEIETLVMS